MNLSEQLKDIFKRLDGKILDPDAFHLRQLIPSSPCDPRSLDEDEYWEYKIGDDTINIHWGLLDIIDDVLDIELNGKTVYFNDPFSDIKKEALEFDEAAEELFKLIMEHGGGKVDKRPEIYYECENCKKKFTYKEMYELEKYNTCDSCGKEGGIKFMGYVK